MSLTRPTTSGSTRPSLTIPGQPAGGGGGSSQTFLSTSDSGYSEIGTTGKVGDDGDNLSLTIDSGTTAAVTGDGLSGLIGAGLWDMGAVSGSVPVTLEVVIDSMPNSSRLVVAMGIGTVPTSLATIKSGNPYWMEIFKNGANYSTRCKVGTAGLLSSNFENTNESVAVTIQVAADDIGYGPGHVSHLSIKSSVRRRDTSDSGTKYTHSSGDLWYAVLWGKSATASGEETITASVEVKS